MTSFAELRKIADRIFTGGDLGSVRIALVGDTSTQFLAIAIKGMAKQRGYRIEMFEAGYNQVELQLLDSSSDLYQFAADFIVVFQSTHKLCELHSLLPQEQKTMLAEKRLMFVDSICCSPVLAGKTIIYFNYPEIEDTVYGSYANKVVSSFTYQVRKLNWELMKLSQKYSNLYICYVAGLQNKLGRDVLFAANFYTNTEMVLSIDALPYIAGRVMDIICAVKGQFKKCLILDLDNTIWGGVIGEDGLEGIQLGHSLGIGTAFTEFQMWIKKLRERGVIICIVSKNDETVAKEPFERHPDMVLNLEDIAVFLANWETKVDNIRTIQKILNIGFDSMVFLDDSSFERSIVRENIPGITVPELPDDPAGYLEYLYSLNLFETASFSSEDKNRTRQYQEEAQRVSLSKTFTNEFDFLKSLEMVASVSGLTKFIIPRVAQLSQRSNQFNLRTVRYTDVEVEAMAQDSETIVLCFTLGDRLGEYGLIAVVVMKPYGKDSLFVENWLMSCRVLKRGVEDFTLNTMVEAAKNRGYKRIVGEYLPSAKNKMVESLYPAFGFTRIGGMPTAQYELLVDDYHERKSNIADKENYGEKRSIRKTERDIQGCAR